MERGQELILDVPVRVRGLLITGHEKTRDEVIAHAIKSVSAEPLLCNIEYWVFSKPPL